LSLSPASAAAAKVSVSGLCALGDTLYWVEGRPELAGAKVVCRLSADGASAEVISPPGCSFGSRVHEYGGGELCVTDLGGPLVIGVRASDQAIVSFRPGDREVTLVLGAVEGERRGGLDAVASTLVFVAEHLSANEGAGAQRMLRGVDLRSGRVVELAAGRDFYATPTLCPDANELAFLAWDHPEMPWEAAELWSAQLAGLEIFDLDKVAGGKGTAVSSPVFAQTIGTTPFHALCWLEEIDGFARPVMEKFPLGVHGREHGGPLWGLGEHHLVASAGRLFAHGVVDGLSRLFEISENAERDLQVEGTSITSLVVVERNGAAQVAWLGATPDALAAVGWVEPETGQQGLLELGPHSPLGANERARARSLSVTGPRGAVGALVFEPPEGTAPYPGVLFCHGGPTGMARAGYDPLVQLLTSHGFCVVAPNFAGSTGYGAEVRHRLNAQWGVADVDDCVAVADALVSEGLLEAGHLGIRGTSAGGFTALLAARSGRFAATCSWYGVADLVTLAATTHDFEAHYTDSLVGPLPEALELYRERSPVNHAGQIRSAVLLLQGTEDAVVPPAQAEAMAAALSDAGQEVTVRFFEGEAHGFRRFETLEAAYGAELALYQCHLTEHRPVEHRLGNLHLSEHHAENPGG
jgi:dienelactone hydrolase